LEHVREQVDWTFIILSMWKALRPLDALITGFKRKNPGRADRSPRRFLERPSREDVLNGFRFILGRELANEGAINEHMRISNLTELRRALLTSDEFKGIYRAMLPDAYDHPSLSMGRETLAFIHLQKTGGSSLRAMLEAQFPPDRRCPVRDDKLHLLSAAELGHYDFFSGHFDRSAIRLIPRTVVRTIALFREPRARLISFYRFLRSHPVRDEFSADPLMRFANELSAEDFFENAEIRSHVGVYNHYLIALGGSYAWFEYTRASLTRVDFSRALEEAKKQIHGLTALGITERFSESVALIWGALNLLPPPSIETAYVTDKLPTMDTRFQRVDPVAMTPRLAAALAELTVYDDELYRFAIREFERRCTEVKDCGA
jgi:hypothetical protein